MAKGCHPSGKEGDVHREFKWLAWQNHLHVESEEAFAFRETWLHDYWDMIMQKFPKVVSFRILAREKNED